MLINCSTTIVLYIPFHTSPACCLAVIGIILTKENEYPPYKKIVGDKANSAYDTYMCVVASCHH